MYLIKTDVAGNLQTAAGIQNGTRHPLPSLLYTDGHYYTAGMDETGLFTRLMQVDENTCSVTASADVNSLIYPLAFSATDQGNILLLSYNRNNYRSQLSEISPGGQVAWTREVNVYQDTETQIVAHLNGTGKRYPFYTAEWNGKYIANCFYNYSFSFLVFGSQGTPESVYNGSNYNSGTSALFVSENGDAALARFSFGQSYLLPTFTLPVNTIDLTDNMGGALIEDAQNDSEFRFGNLRIDNSLYTAFAYNTQSGRVCLALLDAAGSIKARKYFGSSENPFALANFRATRDKGLLLAGTYRVAGSLARPALFRLNEKELYEMLGLDYEKAQKD